MQTHQGRCDLRILKPVFGFQLSVLKFVFCFFASTIENTGDREQCDIFEFVSFYLNNRWRSQLSFLF